MKYLILLTFFPFISLAQDGENTYLLSLHEFEKGSTQYLFGDRVVLRKEAGKESPSVDTLQIGTALKIIEKSEHFDTYSGMQWPWYRVKAGKKTGYVLGALISFNNETCAGGRYLVNMRTTEETAFARYRYLKNDGSFLEGETELDTWQFTTVVSGNRGVKNLEDILYISFYADACGMNGGGVYIFNDGQELIEAFRQTEVADGGFWYTEELIFPEEENGVSDKIVFRRENGEAMDSEMNWTEIQTTLFHLEWSQGRLYPEIPKMRYCE